MCLKMLTLWHTPDQRFQITRNPVFTVMQVIKTLNEIKADKKDQLRLASEMITLSI